MTPPVDGLDHQYNTRAWAPGFAATLERHRALGGPLRRRPGVRLDVPWGEGPRQKFDYFPPEGRLAALAVFIHGGYWQIRASTKEFVAFLAPPFLERGIGYCALGYELCPEVDMDGMVAQMAQACRFIEQTLDAKRMVILGHSAGGHLAAMLALNHPGIAGACGVSGLYDLSPLVSTYLNEALGMDTEMARRNSPLMRASAGALPMVLGVGSLESPEFKRQMSEFARATGASIHELEGMDHYAATEALLSPGAFQEDVMRLFC